MVATETNDVIVSMVSVMNIHELTTRTTRTNRHTTIWGQFSQSGEKNI